jgi:ribosomal protein S13
MERQMILEQLREVAGVGGPAAQLANELLVLADKKAIGELSQEEFEYLVREIADIRAQQELANDEIACRWIVAAAQAIISVV